MSANGRKSADDVIALALASGSTLNAAVEKANVSPRTIQRRLNDPAFTAQVAEYRSRMIDGSIDAMSAAMSKAVETLVDLLSAQRESVRAVAAKSLIQLALETRTAHELERPVAAVEARAKPTPLKVAAL